MAPTLYDWAGGAEALDRLTQAFYHRVHDDPILAPVFAGMSPDGLLPETIEFADHPWFIGVQFHPELKSKPFEPHPLFASFIAAAKAQSRLV